MLNMKPSKLIKVNTLRIMIPTKTHLLLPWGIHYPYTVKMVDHGCTVIKATNSSEHNGRSYIKHKTNMHQPNNYIAVPKGTDKKGCG